MMRLNPEELIDNLQKKPYATRVKILWGSIIVVALILVLVWILGLRSTIGHLDTADLIKTPTKTLNNSTPVNYGQVEWAQSDAGGLKIFFNFNNQTQDILNVPALSNISLDINGSAVTPIKITDRQGNPFVQKVLSHTQNFGILVFPRTPDGTGSLTFDQMFFELFPDRLLSQEIDIDLKKLEKTGKLRN